MFRVSWMSDLIKLYPSILILWSSLWIEVFKKVSDREIMSVWYSGVWYTLEVTKFWWNHELGGCSNSSDKKIKNEYLGPGLVLTSPHWESKFVIQRNKKIITFVTLDCVDIKQG